MGFFKRNKGLNYFKRCLRTAKEPKDAPGDRRIIKTGRTVDEINAAARQGFRPLVKWVIRDRRIHSKAAVFQDPETGVIAVSGDFRWEPEGEKVMDYTVYYHYNFPEPFAAYLLPKDLVIGEEVWLEDLIEDLVAAWGNQAYNPRLEAAPAIWNGSTFDILFNPYLDAEHWIG